jgi:asparagine synthase (glutamine-hydrolysing)
MVFPDWTLSEERIGPDSTYQHCQSTDPYADLRVVEFILSLPSVPWLHQKYIQNRAMQGYLPEQVLTRPKTPAGAIMNSVFQQPNLDWLDDWQAAPALGCYVNRNLVPRIAGRNIINSGIHLRPLKLNHLLAHYQIP